MAGGEGSAALFRLPYQHAKMRAERTPTGQIRYESRRIGAPANEAICRFDYAPGEELPPAAPGSLEFFLIERYRLYASAPEGLRRGAVAHPPYPLCRAEVVAWDEQLLKLNGFTPTGRTPDHAIMSRGVDVTVFPLGYAGR